MKTRRYTFVELGVSALDLKGAEEQLNRLGAEGYAVIGFHSYLDMDPDLGKIKRTIAVMELSIKQMTMEQIKKMWETIHPVGTAKEQQKHGSIFDLMGGP